MELDVSIIIVNYNTRQMTAECIDSVFEKTTGISFEVIVVDNASKDNSREFFSVDKRIIYIYNDENIGFGRANNKGIEIACGRNILFLNSDTLLVNNAIKILSDYLDAHDDVGACGGNLYNYKREPSTSFNKYFPSIFRRFSELCFNVPAYLIYGQSIKHNYSRKALRVGYISGADLMVKNKVLIKAGGFNPIFFMYSEEIELCYRIYRAGYKIYSVPSAKVIHLEGRSFSKNGSERKDKMMMKSHYLYYALTHGKVYVWVANLFWIMSIYTHLAVYCWNNNYRQYWIRERKRYRIYKMIEKKRGNISID